MFHVEQICPSIPRYAYSDIRRENKLFQTRHMLSIKQIKMYGENHIIPQRFGGMHLNRCRLVLTFRRQWRPSEVAARLVRQIKLLKK